MKNRVRPITDRQAEVLSLIKLFMGENGYSPSVDEIANKFGILHNAARDRLMALEKKKYIVRTPGVARSIVLPEQKVMVESS